MKRRNGTLYTLVPVLLTLALYLVFYQRIECKPTDAGFWIIIAFGMSLGVALTSCFRDRKAKTSDDK